jgi:glucose-fructose oxidoreductase
MEDGRVSRRGFLSTTGQAALGLPLLARAAPALAQVPQFPLPEIPGKKLGWAIVGLGRLAVNQILPGLVKAQRSRLAAFVSGSPDKARRLAQVYGLPEKSIYRYPDMERLANDPAVDVVYVVLPNSMHAEYTIRALKAGKHVLCEKPMANTPKECEDMIAAAKAANRKLMIGYRLHYEPYNQALVKIAKDTAEMGPTRLILAEAGFSIGDPAQWRLHKAMAGGGSLMDIGIYALQAARYLAGAEPTEVDAQISTTPDDPRFTEVEENVTFQLRFPGALLASCASSYGVGVNRFRVCKPNGAAELDPALSYSGLRMRVLRGGSIEERSHPVIDQFQTEMDHFSGCVLDGTEPLTPGEEGLRDLRIMMAIYESARGGKPVALSS